MLVEEVAVIAAGDVPLSQPSMCRYPLRAQAAEGPVMFISALFISAFFPLQTLSEQVFITQGRCPYCVSNGPIPTQGGENTAVHFRHVSVHTPNSADHHCHNLIINSKWTVA